MSFTGVFLTPSIPSKLLLINSKTYFNWNKCRIRFEVKTENFFCEKSVFEKDNLYRLLSFNESFGFHTEIFLVFEFLNFEIFLVSKCTFKKPDMKLKEGEKCRIASLLTSKRKCKQYFISKSSFFVLSCGSILYALSSAVLFAFTSSVSIHIYSPQGVSRNYFPYTQQLPHSKGISVSPGQINWATRYFLQRQISYTSFEWKCGQRLIHSNAWCWKSIILSSF